MSTNEFYSMGCTCCQQQDYATALELFTKASAQGYAPADNMLGLMYWQGQGVAQDHARALDLFRRAEANGCREAAQNLQILLDQVTGGQRPAAPVAERTSPELPENANPVLGILGAVLGAAVGCAIIVAIALMGYWAAIGGVALAALTFWFSKKLGKGLTKTTIAVSIVLIILATFLASRMTYAVYSMIHYGFGFFESFYLIPYADEISDLLQLYLFTALGAIPSIRQAIQNR